MISIALIDDHPLAVNGIGAWLIGTGRFTIAGTAGTLAEAEKLMNLLEALPQIVILDISLGEEDGLELIPSLRDIYEKRNVPLPGILVCSMYEDPFLIKQAIDSGVKAYVPKSADSSEILKAIDALLEGNTYINPKYKITAPKQPWTILTRRENEIVSLLKRNFSTKQIAKRLFISIRTVENHLANIYEKTGFGSKDDLKNL